MEEKIIFLKPNSIKPYENNAKIHNDDQIEALIKSISEFGFTNPVLIDESNNCIAGHGRLIAAKRMGLNEVPCRIIKGLSDEQKRALILADNKIAEMAEWDHNKLALELGEIESIDMSCFGFEIDDVSPNSFGTEFTLPDGEKSEIVQMTFTLHENQKELIDYAMNLVKDDIAETFGNTNKNGNALYEVVREWAEQRK